MRLIDADALLYVISPAVEPGGKVYDPDIPAYEMRDYIRDMPEIDAIPVEWLEGKELDYRTTGDMLASYAFEAAINDWKKEHGLDNSNKTGVWEPLGHRIGFGKHPLSEDFRCPLCGYEAYTVLNPPLNRCPRCNAELSLKQEAHDVRTQTAYD